MWSHLEIKTEWMDEGDLYNSTLTLMFSICEEQPVLEVPQITLQIEVTPDMLYHLVREEEWDLYE